MRMMMLLIVLMQSWSGLSVEVVHVLNKQIITQGITGPSLIDWFTNKNKTVKQTIVGKYYYPLPDVYYHNDCTQIKEASEAAGAFTDKLFFLSVNKACVDEGNGYRLVMIIKEVKQGAVEIKNLTRILKVWDKFKMDDPKAASLSPALNFFEYKNQQGEEKYFTLIKAARGQPLANLLKTESDSEIKKIFYNVGTALALFHLKFMDSSTETSETSHGRIHDFWKTMVHGDAHLNNIFYNKETGKTTLIDIETVAYSLDKKYSIAVDLERFYNLPVYIWGQYNGCSIEKANTDCTKVVDAYKSFFDGYVKTYPKDKQGQIKNYIKLFFLHNHRITFIPYDEENFESQSVDIEAQSKDLKSAEKLSQSLGF